MPDFADLFGSALSVLTPPWWLVAAWRPPKRLKSRPAYDIVIPTDSAAIGFDGVPFSDDEDELTPGADEDIQSPRPLRETPSLRRCCCCPQVLVL